MSPKKELLWGLWVRPLYYQFPRDTRAAVSRSPSHVLSVRLQLELREGVETS